MAATVSDEDRDEMAIPSYLHSNPAMRYMAWWRVEAVAAYFRALVRSSDQRLSTVMDFGCGTGVLFDEALKAANTLYGVDLVLDPARLLVEEWDLESVLLMKPDEAFESIPPGSLDAIIAAEVLEHIEPVDGTLDFFRDRLAPGGTLLVSLPTESALYRLGRRLAGFEGHYHESNAANVHEKILAAGFRETRMRKIPAPGPLAIYWIIAYQPA